MTVTMTFVYFIVTMADSLPQMDNSKRPHLLIQLSRTQLMQATQFTILLEQ